MIIKRNWTGRYDVVSQDSVRLCSIRHDSAQLIPTIHPRQKPYPIEGTDNRIWDH